MSKIEQNYRNIQKFFISRCKKFFDPKNLNKSSNFNLIAWNVHMSLELLRCNPELSTVGIPKNLSPRVLEIFQPEIQKNLNDFSDIDLEYGILITYVRILEILYPKTTNRTSTFSY